MSDIKDFVIVLVKGQKTDDTDFWAYIAVHPSKYAAFKIAEEKGAYNLNDYGKIIRSGEGATPPADVQAFMAKEYDFTDTLEQTLKDYLSQNSH